MLLLSKSRFLNWEINFAIILKSILALLRLETTVGFICNFCKSSQVFYRIIVLKISGKYKKGTCGRAACYYNWLQLGCFPLNFFKVSGKTALWNPSIHLLYTYFWNKQTFVSHWTPNLFFSSIVFSFVFTFLVFANLEKIFGNIVNNTLSELQNY